MARFYVVGAAVGAKVKILHDVFATCYRRRIECAQLTTEYARQ